MPIYVILLFFKRAIIRTNCFYQLYAYCFRWFSCHRFSLDVEGNMSRGLLKLRSFRLYVRSLLGRCLFINRLAVITMQSLNSNLNKTTKKTEKNNIINNNRFEIHVTTTTGTIKSTTTMTVERHTLAKL